MTITYYKMPQLFNQQYFFTSLIRQVYLALIATIALLSFSNLFFALQWRRACSIENIFLVAHDQTLQAHKAPAPFLHSHLEINTFAQMLLSKAFALNEYTWDQHLSEVTSFMDQASAQCFRAKMDPDIEALYKEHNAISTVELQHIEINTEQQPYEVLLYYNTSLKFASGTASLYQDAEAPGGLYFQLQPLQRANSNPYGLQIRNLKFLPPLTDKSPQK
ncbi:MAG: hypothetical protein ROO73_05990 [Roseivirga sp.]